MKNNTPPQPIIIIEDVCVSDEVKIEFLVVVREKKRTKNEMKYNAEEGSRNTYYIISSSLSLSHMSTSGSAFSLMVRLADVCCMKIFAIPILIFDTSSFIASCTRGVMR